ncbi:hypothetical protein K469DRAFT_668401 [Zopfia rhizophila CBS 207.26]|uniref:F-box domain-containing protein n=1 Tax=Zopfia rhizophila CBS 207.26 TaxID=1314779 RepID=A0A6A6DUN4_9PEZI|nr:hypothetical protein K469DRAFT_668401 [Zopfia rhizophila CBS 207.26]
MANLPHELVDRICGLLTLDDLKNTVTVSRSFQYASERASGAYAEFDLTRDNAQAFLSLYSGRRWGYLRHVRFRTHIPPYEEDENDEQDEPDGGGSRKTHRCRESLQELREKDELFTKQINFVFTTLRTIENNVSSGKLQLTIYTPVREVHACPHRKSISWRLHLQTPDILPELTSVHALCLDDETIIDPLEEDKSLLKVDLRILIDLAIKLPRLEFLGCKLSAGSGWTTELSTEAARHYTRDWAGPYRDTRHDFAKALETAALPSTLRQAQLNFLYPLSAAERIDQSQKVPNLVSPAAYDPFSSSLRLLSHQLRKLELKVVADATLFWPADGAASWPNLESICVLFHISSPSGRWYFEGPRGDGHDTKGFEVTSASYPPLEDTSDDEAWDEDIDENGLDTSTITTRRFRVQPNDEVLVPFLTAFAKAASSMPALKEACLWAPLTWDAGDVDGDEDYDTTQIAKWLNRPLAWGITYVAPATFGFHPFPGQHYSESRQLWWTTAQWRPGDELRHLFQQIGDQNTELIEYWGHEKYDQKLALRLIFDQFEIFGSRHPDSPWPVKLSED